MNPNTIHHSLQIANMNDLTHHNIETKAFTSESHLICLYTLGFKTRKFNLVKT